MLRNGLGEILRRQIRSRRRFVDLFSGSAAVSIHMARTSKTSVFASDIQQYSAILANAVIARDDEFSWERSWNAWFRRAKTFCRSYRPPVVRNLTRARAGEIRDWCFRRRCLPITKAYGGHYFSAKQALQIDALRQTLPAATRSRTIALAALIRAASRCAAAPGHTAQPLQPTRSGKKHLIDAWSRDVFDKTKASFEEMSSLFAKKSGVAAVGDANVIANKLKKTDLVFIDPPYSGVHYSRFYHVLETIARGRCGKVDGVGRYPARRSRPQSKYSAATSSRAALDDLFKTVARCGAKAIVTFPACACSNGLSGKIVRDIAGEHFRVRERVVRSKFSSLGGTGKKRNGKKHRNARKGTNELILFLSPK